MSTEEDNDNESGTKTLTRPEQKVKNPSMYKVLLLNDDYTPMDFVILILMQFFKKDEVESAKIMLEVHNNGAGKAGVYTFEVAETKVHLVNQFSNKNKHPLKCVMEPE